MQTATVKWFNYKKGFGFLVPETGGSDIFVHISALEKSGLTALNDGQRVSFELEPDRKGRLCASQIKVVA